MRVPASGDGSGSGPCAEPVPGPGSLRVRRLDRFGDFLATERVRESYDVVGLEHGGWDGRRRSTASTTPSSTTCVPSTRRPTSRRSGRRGGRAGVRGGRGPGARAARRTRGRSLATSRRSRLRATWTCSATRWGTSPPQLPRLLLTGPPGGDVRRRVPAAGRPARPRRVPSNRPAARRDVPGSAAGAGEALTAYASDCVARDDCPLEGLPTRRRARSSTSSRPTDDPAPRAVLGRGQAMAFNGVIARSTTTSVARSRRRPEAGVHGDGAAPGARGTTDPQRESDGTYEATSSRCSSPSTPGLPGGGASRGDGGRGGRRSAAAEPLLGGFDGRRRGDVREWPVPAVRDAARRDRRRCAPILVIGQHRRPGDAVRVGQAWPTSSCPAGWLT